MSELDSKAFTLILGRLKFIILSKSKNFDNNDSDEGNFTKTII